MTTNSTSTAAVVIELGSRFTRVGFAGEASCRFVFDSPPSDDDAVERVLQHIVFKLLHVVPSERTFVVVMATLTPRATRQRVATVLLRQLGAAALAFVRAEVVALIALRRRSALLVDSGHAETRLVPVVELVVLETQLRTSPAASMRANRIVVDALRLALPPDVVADPALLARVAEHARLSHVHLAALDARTDDSVSLALSASLSASLPRALLNSAALDVLGADDDDRPLAALLVDSLLASPIDARALLAHNVCVVGGGACAQGYAAALQRAVDAELRRRDSPDAAALASHLRVSSHAKMPASLVCWIGASLVAAAGELAPEFLTRDQFELLDGRWPDAQSIAPPVTLPAVATAAQRAAAAPAATAQMT